MAANAPPIIPYIHLLCMEESCSEAFTKAAKSYQLPASVQFELHRAALQFVPDTANFDLVVSPANSYGRLDGGFDDVISRAFSPRGDYLALTHVAQAKLYDEWCGFAPPGSCTLVRIPDEFRGRSKNVWGTRYIALCPTMRTPQEVEWDREVVYESIWSLLVAIDKHNRARPEDRISSILMTPLATGTGRVSPERWAHQMFLAMKHFVDAKRHPDKWSKLETVEIFEYANEVSDTWTM
ncbi:phage tail assembly-like protein, partial [Metarhizium majus ARSEF 297]